MRVTKDSDGKFVVEEEPITLDGRAGEAFLEDMRVREATPDSPERKNFIADCRRAYLDSLAKRVK